MLVCFSAHWYLAIICFPGEREPVYADSAVPSPSSSSTQQQQEDGTAGPAQNGEGASGDATKV